MASQTYILELEKWLTENVCDSLWGIYLEWDDSDMGECKCKHGTPFAINVTVQPPQHPSVAALHRTMHDRFVTKVEEFEATVHA